MIIIILKHVTFSLDICHVTNYSDQFHFNAIYNRQLPSPYSIQVHRDIRVNYEGQRQSTRF